MQLLLCHEPNGSMCVSYTFSAGDDQTFIQNMTKTGRLRWGSSLAYISCQICVEAGVWELVRYAGCEARPRRHGNSSFSSSSRMVLWFAGKIPSSRNCVWRRFPCLFLSLILFFRIIVGTKSWASRRLPKEGRSELFQTLPKGVIRVWIGEVIWTFNNTGKKRRITGTAAEARVYDCCAEDCLLNE